MEPVMSRSEPSPGWTRTLGDLSSKLAALSENTPAPDTSSCTLLPVEPGIVHAHWSLTASALEKLAARANTPQANADLHLRLFSLPDADASLGKASTVTDIPLPGPNSTRLLDVPEGATLTAVAGALDKDGRFYPAAESNTISVPISALPVEPKRPPKPLPATSRPPMQIVDEQTVLKAIGTLPDATAAKPRDLPEIPITPVEQSMRHEDAVAVLKAAQSFIQTLATEAPADEARADRSARQAIGHDPTNVSHTLEITAPPPDYSTASSPSQDTASADTISEETSDDNVPSEEAPEQPAGTTPASAPASPVSSWQSGRNGTYPDGIRAEIHVSGTLAPGLHLTLFGQRIVPLHGGKFTLRRTITDQPELHQLNALANMQDDADTAFTLERNTGETLVEIHATLEIEAPAGHPAEVLAGLLVIKGRRPDGSLYISRPLPQGALILSGLVISAGPLDPDDKQ